MRYSLTLLSTKKIISHSTIYASFIFRALSFLLLAPILSRTLSANAWGGFLAAQTLSLWLIVVFEFGFSLSFSKKITLALDNKGEVNLLVSQVLSAKMLLIPIAIVLTALISMSNVFLNQKELAWLGLAWAVTQSFAPMWYFQATENLQWYSILDSFFRIVYILFIYLIIDYSEKPSVIFLILILSSSLFSMISLTRMFRETGLPNLSFLNGVRAIIQGFPLASFTLTTSLYTTASLIVLGIFENASLVAVYGNADRILRASLSVIAPLNQITLPQSAKAYGVSRQTGLQFTKKAISLYGIFSLFLSLLGYFFAPFIIKILFGEKYASSLLYLRYLLVLIPLISINTVFVYHFLIPNNKDKIVNLIFVIASIVSLISMFILVPMYSLIGMVFSVVVPEIIAMFALIYFFSKFSAKKNDGKL